MAQDSTTSQGENQPQVISYDGASPGLDIPTDLSIRDAEFSREGVDLHIQTDSGEIVIEGYFVGSPPPTLLTDSGEQLSANIINAFTKGTPRYASGNTATDESPVGLAQELSGDVTVTRVDGSVETVHKGTPIFQGDIVETSDGGAVNIIFIDETSFAVSEDARIAIDEFVFDPASSEGSTHFSILKGVFVYTSGLIGREDPDDVMIDTPVGSIGIRGTIIAGDTNSGEITVVEGAIVLRDFNGNEFTLADQFATARFNPGAGSIDSMGTLSAADVGAKFVSVSGVSPQLFSSINDVAQEQAQDAQGEQGDNAGYAETSGENAGDAGDAGAQDGRQQPAQSDALQADTQTQPATPQPAAKPAPSLDLRASLNQTDPLQTIANDAEAARAEPQLQQQGADQLAEAPPPAGNGTPIAPPPLERTEPQDATKTPGSTEKSVDLQLVNTTLGEHVVGTLAQVTINGGNISDIRINAPHQVTQHLSIVQQGTTNVFDIVSTANGLDFDELLNFGIINASGNLNIGVDVNYADGTSLSDSAPLTLVDVDEAPIVQGTTTGLITTQILDSALEGSNWSYEFRELFHDPEGSIMTYTITSPIDNGGSFNTYSFNGTTGLLTMSFNTNDGDGYVTFDVTATDINGNSTTEHYVVNYYGTGTAITSNIDVDYMLVEGTASNDIADLGATTTHFGNTVLLGDGDDALTISNSSYENDIYATSGINTFTITAGAYDNFIQGGVEVDIFNIYDIRNSLHGNADDDVFIIDMSDTASLSYLTTHSGPTLIDGGVNDQYALDVLGSYSELPQYQQYQSDGFTESGRGDALEFVNAGNIDFSAIATETFKNIETLDFSDATNQNVTLDYNSVLSMTEKSAVLVLEMGAEDSLTYINNGPQAMQLVANNVNIQNNRADLATTYNNYDVYSDGIVTLLVDTDAGAVTGLS